MLKLLVREELLGSSPGPAVALDWDGEVISAREVIRRRVRAERAEAAHLEAVCEAFETGQLLILVGDAQVEDLDAPLLMREGDEVTFLKLVPLVGG